MVAAHIRIAPLTSTAAIDPAELRDLIHVHATGSGIEHLRVRAGPDSADILAFVDSGDPTEAATTLRRIVDRTIASTPLLGPWRIV
ncbi:hypothetical protein JNW91_30330 [Micromonospora sp. STR1_7]|uniref:Lrp/AsnC family transcriptional regulator n=1 Tax=Micromonospora parastrephiae TaxID=2806101 RepID=A0ABS1Y2F0_9ACTN|nr:hypothetical protein [Micromonospora parastrephiae]MBM0235685.1 hypothetical protein [Micromonospora parastrephiae]